MSERADALDAEALRPREPGRWIGRELRVLGEVDSTNRVAFELARDGAAAGTVVVAESQTAGRGRLGRSFFSPPHRNLYASIVLRPRLAIADAPTLVLAAAIAVAEAVARVLKQPERVEIKWPNDVLIDGRKTSGILVETSAEGGAVAFAILGIGVNLNVGRDEFPAAFRDSATSVSAELSGPVDRAAFARSLFGILEDVLDTHQRSGFASLRGRFDSWFRMPGREVEVHGHGPGVLRGTALGIAADGSLRVQRSDGSVELVIAGDVSLSGRPR
jgi:BirA family biotin operon repressor/biotin-[acetyl-CoA-carboxylase] ligase